MSQTGLNRWLGILLGVYTLFLVWAILLKTGASLAEIRELSGVRHVNLVPFAGGISEALHRRDIVDNVLVFLPFGGLLALAPRPGRWGEKLLCIPLLSLCLESAQFGLAVGRSDVTDLITNTAGGFLGVLAVVLLLKAAKDRDRMRLGLAILATVGEVLLAGLLGVLIAGNGPVSS